MFDGALNMPLIQRPLGDLLNIFCDIARWPEKKLDPVF